MLLIPLKINDLNNGKWNKNNQKLRSHQSFSKSPPKDQTSLDEKR